MGQFLLRPYKWDYDSLTNCGDDVWISEHSHIRYPELVRIGNHCAIDAEFYCTTRLYLSDYVHLAVGCKVIGGKDALLIVDAFAEVSPNVTFVCASDAWLGEGLVSPLIPKEYRDKILNAPINLRPFSGVGTNSVVMPGVTLHEGAVLGANSLAKQDLEAWTIYAGNPAKPIGKRRSDKMKEYAHSLGYDL